MSFALLLAGFLTLTPSHVDASEADARVHQDFPSPRAAAASRATADAARVQPDTREEERSPASPRVTGLVEPPRPEEAARVQPDAREEEHSPASPRVTGPAEATRAFLTAHHVQVTTASGTEVAAETLRALAEGLERLPPALRHFPGGPLTLVLHEAPRPYGMGDPEEAEAAPRWTEGRRRFHLFDVAPAKNSVARDTEALSPQAHTRLWRQRALVHAILQRWEDVEQFSRERRWRRVMGWRAPLEQGLHLQERPRNVFAGAYLRPQGQRSAAWDWLTFAEAYFVRVEMLAPGRLPIASTLPCQEPSRIRALEALLHARGLLEAPPRAPACAPFEAWARPDALEHIEVLLVAPSGRQAESLFGHLLLRPVHRDGALGVGPGMASVVQLAALAEPKRAGLRRVWRGLTGGYVMTVFTLTQADLVEEALHDQQRTIRRYRLNLQPDAARQVLERAWEAERRGYFRYTFLSGNCAHLLAFLVEPALPAETRIRFGGLWLVSPGSTLDALSRVKVEGANGERTSLLSYVPGDLEATGEQAERSEAKRRALEAVLTPSLPQATRGDWTRALVRIRAQTVASRAAAYRELSALSAQVPRSQDAALHAWWAHSVRVERDRVERARHTLLELARDTVLEDALPQGTVGDRLAVRQALFGDPEALAEHALLIDRTEAERVHLASLPHREDTEDEARRRAEAETTLAQFSELTALQAELNLHRLSAQQGHAVLAEDARLAREDDARWARRALVRSGAWRWALGGGWRDGTTPFLRLRTAALAESLGDQRLHGLHPSTELRVMDGQVDVTVGANGWPRVVASDLTLVGLRTLARKPPHLRRGPLDALGFGLALQLDRRPERHLRQRLQAVAESWLPLESEDGWHRFSALGFGVGVGGLWGPLPSGEPFRDEAGALHPAAGGLGPRIAWRSRFGLSAQGPAALHLSGHAQSTWLGLRSGGRPGWLHELELEAALELPLSFGGERRGVLRPGAALSVDGVGAGALRPVSTLSLSFEPIR